MVPMFSLESCSLLNWALKDSMKLFARGDPGSVNRCVDAGGDAPADQRAGGLERPARDDAQRIAGIRVDDDPDVS